MVNRGGESSEATTRDDLTVVAVRERVQKKNAGREEVPIAGRKIRIQGGLFVSKYKVLSDGTGRKVDL